MIVMNLGCEKGVEDVSRTKILCVTKKIICDSFKISTQVVV